MIYKFLISFITRKGEPDPLRFWIQVFILLCIIMMIQKMFGVAYFSDFYMSQVFSFTGVLLGADTWSTHSKRRYENGNNGSPKDDVRLPNGDPASSQP